MPRTLKRTKRPAPWQRCGYAGTRQDCPLPVARGVEMLNTIATLFGLTTTELGRLFGAKRQGIDCSREQGVPATRVADVGRVTELAAKLARGLKAERIPQVARTLNAALGAGGLLCSAVSSPLFASSVSLSYS